MAHWAEIDTNNIVLRVTVGSNNEPDEGYQWLIDNLGGRWIKTSYNSRGGKKYKTETTTQTIPSGEVVEISYLVETDEPHFRYNFAGIGYTYDEVRDAFIPPKPEIGEWILNEDTCQWDEVVPTPEGE